jgi:hemerythrin-like domain-containing protein
MEENVSAVEDLMREHGLLNRILLIYEEFIRLISINQPMNIAYVHAAALLMKSFVHNYHEKTEEKYVFPLLLKQNKSVEMVTELITQHELGKNITEDIINLTSNHQIEDLTRVSLLLKNFIKMYRYHESREDTVIFGEFKTSIKPEEYNEIGELFEKEEDEVLGKGGFQHILNDVTDIEKRLGIFELHKITVDIKTELNLKQ